MKHSKLLKAILLLVFLFSLVGCSSGPSAKDIIGKWENTKFSNVWMEFYADMSSTGGKWSITKDGKVKIENADGTLVTAILKDGKLIFEEFGENGVFVKEASKKE